MERVTDEIPEDWLRKIAVIVVAHPDDEVIGLGAVLPRLYGLQAIVHVTDGAPRNGEDIRKAGVNTWQEYAQLRRGEFQATMRAAGVAEDVRQICLECPDQEASFRITEIARRLCGVFEELRAEVVWTHPYEGGHPDHDATACAVHCALGHEMIALEFSSYHQGPHGMETECFLPEPSGRVYQHVLTDEEKRAKRKLFECYASQREVLQYFPAKAEPVRRAPIYDFAQPPHAGRLYYENFSWGVTGAQWRELATQALHDLGLSV